MNHELERFKAVADAIANLFFPNVEVAIHEIETDTIFHLANPVSGRKPGDPSNLELNEQDLDGSDLVIGPYENTNRTGQRLRSVTAVLNNQTNQAVGLMCINLDYSVYEPALELLESLIRPPKAQQPPELLFQNDWRDQIKLEINSFLESHQITLEKLTPAIRQKMMAGLNQKGLFFAKRSIDQIASMLGISRATAYNDLNAARKKNNHRNR